MGFNADNLAHLSDQSACLPIECGLKSQMNILRRKEKKKKKNQGFNMHSPSCSHVGLTLNIQVLWLRMNLDKLYSFYLRITPFWIH